MDTGVLCGQDHAFGSSSAEAAWYQDSVYAVKSLVQVFLIEFFGINPGDLYFCLACDSAVLQGFYDALVGIVELSVFSYHCNVYGFVRVAEIFYHFFPVGKVWFALLKSKGLHDHVCQFFTFHGKWCFI